MSDVQLRESTTNRVGSVDFNAARGTLHANEAKLAAQDELGAVDEGEGEQRCRVGAVAVGNQTSIGLDSDVLSVAANELDTCSVVLKLIKKRNETSLNLNSEQLSRALALASRGHGAISRHGEVGGVVALEASLARASGINLKLESLLVGHISLISLDLDTAAGRDELAGGGCDDKLGLAVCDLEELVLGDLRVGLASLEGALCTAAGQVVYGRSKQLRQKISYFLARHGGRCSHRGSQGGTALRV